jgi:hypothetical protein
MMPMSDMPLVSVVTPVFNGGGWLQACVEDVVPAAEWCFDTVHFDLWASDRSGEAYTEVYEGLEYDGPEDEVVVEIEDFEWVGRASGTFSADLLLANPCLGPELLPHRLEVDWTFPDTHEQIEGGGGGGGGHGPVLYEL